jgi:hypothetical protein
MRNCAAEIRRFHNNEVTLTGESRGNMRKRRDANRDRLKSGLAANDDPSPIGCHTQGSYSMHTMVQDPNLDYDIDDGVYFKASDLIDEDGHDVTAEAVKGMVCEALQSHLFNTSPESLDNCVRVYYNEGYHVDVPSYRRFEIGNTWSGVSYRYELAGKDWRDSDPREVTKWFSTSNGDLSPYDDNDQFRRIVRMLKKFARSREAWKAKTMSGFSITKIAADVFKPISGRDDQSLRETMRAIHAQLSTSTVIAHPVVSENLSNVEDSKALFFTEKLEQNLPHLDVLDETDCTHEKAMAAWDKVFCTDWFSQQPPPSEEDDGTPQKAVRKDGGGRFAVEL